MYFHHYAPIVSSGDFVPPPTDTLLTYKARVRAVFATDQALLGSFSPTDLEWDTVVYDDNWGWSPGTSNFVVPAGVTAVSVTAHAQVVGASFEDARIYLRHNSTNLTRRTVDDQFRLVSMIHQMIPVTSGDTIQIRYAIENVRNLDSSQSFVSIVGYGP